MATKSTEVTVIDQQREVKSVLIDMSNRYGMEPQAFEATVRATCMRPDKNGRIPTREEFAAFLLVAKEYNLNPLTKEIYAYSGKGGGIVPIVSVDGWVNLVNSHGQCNGFTFEMEHGEKGQLISCTCNMYRKDREHPVTITEYLAECIRETEPWKMKHRMLRHKAMIQAARYAFGFSGIYDEDEGQKIAEIDPNRDAGPPRQIAKPAEPVAEQTEPPLIEAEDVRDGDPPPREAKPEKEDPISSGPPRTTKPAATAENPPAEIKVAKPKPPEPGPKPHRIPGAGHTFESWAERFCDMVKTSEDTAALYGWIDQNSKDFTTPDSKDPQTGPLKRLEQKKPSVYTTVRKTIEATMQSLRDAQAKAAEKAAKKPAPKKAEPSDMEDGPANDQLEQSLGAPPSDNPEDVLKWVEATLAAVTEPEDLENVWVDRIEPKLEGMFPPDVEEAQGIYKRHEKRLEP